MRRPPPRAARRAILAGAVVLLVAACGSSGGRGSDGGDAGSTAGGSAATAGPGGVPVGFQPASVSFVSADQGFVLGTAPCSTPPCTGVAATDDGGATWRAVAAPATDLATGTSSGDGSADATSTDATSESASSDDTASETTDPATTTPEVGVSRIRFGDHLNGWAFGPSLWSTHDGGEHWSEQDVGGIVTDLASADGVTYAVVSDCPSGACESSATIYRTDATTDGWQPVPDVSLPAQGGQVWAHARAAWFVGPATSDGGPATFLGSADGTTWHERDDPCEADDGVLTGVAPVDTTRLFLLCGNDPAAGSEGKSVWTSTDAGKTSTRTGTLPVSGIADGISAADATTVAVSARSGVTLLYRSGDAGASWDTVLDSPDGGAGYGDLGFATASVGAMVHGLPSIDDGSGVTSELLMTHDAGASWERVSIG